MKTISLSTPASLMITGEHAVLYGHPAIVCAIEKRLFLTAELNKTNKIFIKSNLGEYFSDLNKIIINDRFKFILTAIKNYPQLTGLTITIKSEINHNMGLGSSAALSICLIHALNYLTDQAFDQKTVHKQALRLVKDIQKQASGADLAASLWGNMICYQIDNYNIQKQHLPQPPELFSICYCGYKTPTGQVLQLIAEKMQQNPAKYQNIYQKMGKLARTTIKNAKQQNWLNFYQNINDYQILMQELGVSDQNLEQLIDEANKYGVASKISGSGLGDCIITFCKKSLQNQLINHQLIPISNKGLIIHSTTN